MSHFCYILECNNDTLYTGYTTDLDKRFKDHASMSSKSAKYVRGYGKGPKQFRIAFECEDKFSAMSLEYWIKRLSRNEKLKLINIGLEHPIINENAKPKYKDKVIGVVNYE